jgi:hypothetical protein
MAGEFAAAAVAGDIPRIEAGILAIVEQSFVTHPMRHRTGAEERRRCAFALDKLRYFMHERKWAVDKALSYIAPALTAALDTRNFEVRERTLYVPDELLLAKGIIAQ